MHVLLKLLTGGATVAPLQPHRTLPSMPFGFYLSNVGNVIYLILPFPQPWPLLYHIVFLWNVCTWGHFIKNTKSE